MVESTSAGASSFDSPIVALRFVRASPLFNIQLVHSPWFQEMELTHGIARVILRRAFR